MELINKLLTVCVGLTIAVIINAIQIYRLDKKLNAQLDRNEK